MPQGIPLCQDFFYAQKQKRGERYMQKNKECNAKHFIQYLIFSLTVSFSAVFCIPNIVKQGMGVEIDNGILPIIGFIAACVISFVILLFITYDRRRGTENMKISFGNLMRTVLGTSLIVIFGVIIISLLCGIIASVLYFLLQKIFMFDQIKGLIDFLITVITILTLPFAVSVFWKEMTSDNGFKKAFQDGMSIEKKQYKNLIALLLILFGCGLLFTTMFRFIQANVFIDSIKMILFAVLGTMGMYFSERLVR